MLKDKLDGIDVEKALDTSTGSAIIPDEISPEIQEIAKKATPLLKIIKEVEWTESDTFRWVERTAYGNAEAYAEGDSFSSNDDSVSQENTIIKMVRAERSVSNLLRSTSQNFVNALQFAIEGATQELAQKLEDLYINGNSGTSPKQFDGLAAQISNTLSNSGNAINFDILDDAIQEVIDNGGNPDLIVVSSRDKNKLNKLMRGNVDNIWNKVDTKYGVRLQSYLDLPVVSSQYVKTDKDYGTTTTGDYSEAYVLDTSKIVSPVNMPITYEEVATSSDSLDFRVKTYRALAVMGASVQVKITDIAKP